jgi:hypothetical protein
MMLRYPIKTQNGLLSRRRFGAVLAMFPLLRPTELAQAPPSSDGYLIALGRQFDEIAARFDTAKFTDEFLDRFDRIEAEIVATQARTIEGLRVKARAACWSLMGDLDPTAESTTAERMALSIVRDVVRLCDPELEQPGALARLLLENEAGAATGPGVRGLSSLRSTKNIKL